MSFEQYKLLESLYYDFRKSEDNYIAEDVKKISSFTNGEIAAFVIRMNKSNSFNDVETNNDLLVILENVNDKNFNIFTFNVTADPKSNKPNIAHVLEQIYRGNIRNHRWIFGRIAICSDRGLWYFRTKAGKIIERLFGMIGINIHDNGGFFNSSLGCVILELMSQYKTVFKPLLQRATNKENVPVFIMNQYFFNKILPLQAEGAELLKLVN